MRVTDLNQQLFMNVRYLVDGANLEEIDCDERTTLAIAAEFMSQIYYNI
jgi:hypothetical protein